VHWNLISENDVRILRLSHLIRRRVKVSESERKFVVELFIDASELIISVCADHLVRLRLEGNFVRRKLVRLCS
jgi:hypothetical protein